VRTRGDARRMALHMPAGMLCLSLGLCHGSVGACAGGQGGAKLFHSAGKPLFAALCWRGVYGALYYAQGPGDLAGMLQGQEFADQGEEHGRVLLGYPFEVGLTSNSFERAADHLAEVLGELVGNASFSACSCAPAAIVAAPVFDFWLYFFNHLWLCGSTMTNSI
jgi:hypothetical protein